MNCKKARDMYKSAILDGKVDMVTKMRSHRLARRMYRSAFKELKRSLRQRCNIKVVGFRIENFYEFCGLNALNTNKELIIKHLEKMAKRDGYNIEIKEVENEEFPWRPPQTKVELSGWVDDDNK